MTPVTRVVERVGQLGLEMDLTALLDNPDGDLLVIEDDRALLGFERLRSQA